MLPQSDARNCMGWVSRGGTGSWMYLMSVLWTMLLLPRYLLAIREKNGLSMESL